MRSFRIDGTGAGTTLTPVSFGIQAGGITTCSLVFNQAGTFLFAISEATGNVTTYSFDKETGGVTFKTVQPAGSNGSGNAPGIGYLATGIVVFLSGRITDADGQAISGARVTAINTTHGTTHTALTNPFGYYTFDELILGRNYTLEVRQKQFVFAPQTFTPGQEFNELNFTAQP